MNPRIQQRAAALQAPQPVAAYVFDALATEGPLKRHAAALIAWDVATQVMASSAWAVCRALQLDSTALSRHAASLREPSFATWIGLLREGVRLTAGVKEPEAAALARLSGGLRSPWAGRLDVNAVRELLTEVPEPIGVPGRAVVDMIQAMPTYWSRTHGVEHAPFTDEDYARHASTLLLGLIDFAENTPLAGEFRWVHVRRLDRSAGDVIAAVSVAQGLRDIVDHVRIPAMLADRLVLGGLYLQHDDHFLRLSPIAESTSDPRRPGVALLAGQIRERVLFYLPHSGRGIRRRLSEPAMERLVGAKTPADDASDASDASSDDASLSPWPGLRPYDRDRAEVFCGRDQERIDAVSAVARGGPLVLWGTSGAGKTSLLEAAIIPALRRDAEAVSQRFEVLAVEPGPDPIETLRSALKAVVVEDAAEASTWLTLVDESLPARGGAPPDGLLSLLSGMVASGRQVVLTIDPLDQLVTLGVAADVRQRFLDIVTTAAIGAARIGVAVVFCVGSELAGTLLGHAGLRTLFERHALAVGALPRAALREVVTGPLAARGVAFDEALPEAVARDAGDDPRRLPRISFALSTLWATRDEHGGRLTTEAYERIGGVDGAVARLADGILAASPRGSRPTLNRVFRQLGTLNDAGGVVARRATLGELARRSDASEAKLRKLLEPWTEAGLLRVEDEATGPVVLPVHDSVFRSWPYLEELFLAEREALGLKRRLGASAGGRGRPAGRLWNDRGSALRRVEELVKDGRMEPSREEAAFVRASRTRVAGLRVLAVTLVVVVIAMAFTAFSLWRRTETLRAAAVAETVDLTAQRDLARTDEQAAYTRRDEALRLLDIGRAQTVAAQAATASSNGDPQLAALLAVEAYRIDARAPGPAQAEIVRIARHLLGEQRIPTVFSPDAGALHGIVANADGLVAAAGDDGAIFLFDLDAPLSRPSTLNGHGTPVRALALGGDGRALASGDDGGIVRIWDISAPDGAPTVHELDSPVRAITWDGRARRLVVGLEDGRVMVFDPDSDETQPEELTLLDYPVHDVSFGPRDSLLAVAGGTRTRFWSGEDLERNSTRLASDEGRLMVVAFSPDGRWLATGSRDGAVELWNVGDPEEPDRVYRGHAGEVTSLTFTADGTRLVSTSADGTLRRWRVADPDWPPDVYAGHFDAVTGATLLDDGDRLASAGKDGTLRVWRAERPAIGADEEAGAEALTAALCAASWRNLSAAEWSEYIGDEDYAPTCAAIAPHPSTR